MTTWPPSFTVKKHARARHVKIKASLRKGLEIVVPFRFNLKNIPDVLERNKSWIIKQITRLEEKETSLPTDIIFPAINAHWKVSYVHTEKGTQFRMRDNHEVIFRINTHDEALCRSALAAWCKEQAKLHLLPILAKLSKDIHLPYHLGIIRDQSTRWGSCSAKKNISLNYRLLFLRPELARHVMIHELSHTIHMNHSAKFWELVAKWDPDWQMHKKAILKMKHSLPGWAIS